MGDGVIRAAVIGAGYLGRFHAQKWAGMTGCTLVAIADPSIAVREAVGRELGVEAVADWRELLGRVDAVSVVTPTPLHHPVARACLEAGVHVLVEKPITTTVAEAADLIAVAGASGRVLQVGHLERFNEVVRAIGSSPQSGVSLMYVTLLSAINSAETEVLLTNAYFVPDPQLLDALMAAAKRGVDVRMVLPAKTDSGLVFHIGRSHYEDLLESGVKIFERRDAMLHAKTALIDGVWATVGSTNLDWRSFLHNDEVNAVVLGVNFGNQMRAAFESDVARSEQIVLQKWRSRSLGLRLKESLSRLWQYWL